MSAPVVERPRAGTATKTAPRTTPAKRATATPPAGDAARVRRPKPAAASVRPVAAGRAPFVLTVMVLLGIGLVATLWLSTAAAADSYRLQDARTAARELSERSERLHREVAALQSPPALAQRAGQLGMVPAKDPARLVVGTDGTVTVVGDPTPAVAPPPVLVPGGLDGGVAPAAPTAAAPQIAPEQVLAAAVAAARPMVEEAARQAAAEAGEDAEPDSSEPRADSDSTGDSTDSADSTAESTGAAGQDTDGNGRAEGTADRSDDDTARATRGTSDDDRSDASSGGTAPRAGRTGTG